MDVSILIGTQDDGDALWRTVLSCQESAVGLEHEIIVIDNGSQDDSIQQLRERISNVFIGNCLLAGVAPPRVHAARHARGEVLLFIDAHCKPEKNAVVQLVDDVRACQGRAIILPRIAVLVRESWKTLRHRSGNCLALDLQTMRYHWTSPYVYPWHGPLVETPGLAGGMFAIDRETYDNLHGIDGDMRGWGAEDVDLGLRAWLAGFQVLHDPRVLVGHLFRSMRPSDKPSPADTIANWMRTARKSLGEETWNAWLDQFRDRFEPEQFQQAWLIFQQRRYSVEAQRRHGLATRQRDEFWFAEHFNLDWPIRNRKTLSNSKVVPAQDNR